MFRLFGGVPRLPRENRSGGMAPNQEHFGGWVDMAGIGRSSWSDDVLYDPQTSGGLLVAVAEEAADAGRGRVRCRGCAVVAHRPCRREGWRYPRAHGSQLLFVRRL